MCGERRFRVILTDLCREEGSVAAGSVRRPPRGSRDMEENASHEGGAMGDDARSKFLFKGEI